MTQDHKADRATAALIRLKAECAGDHNVALAVEDFLQNADQTTRARLYDIFAGVGA